MAQIPSGTKFIGLPSTYPTAEKRSSLVNSESGVYTMQDIIDTAGVPGPQGIQGPVGPAGPIGPVGPAGLTWQGAWVSGTSYSLNDAVGYGGASYFCILATSGTTAPDLDTTHWALLASQGAQGPAGATGAQGPTGPAGPGVPTFFEYNSTDKTIWNNGQGDIASNTSFGDEALKSNTTGTNNTAIGGLSLSANTIGANNVAIGGSASLLSTTGSSNVIIGANSNVAATSTSNSIAIGRSTVAASNSTVIGSGASSGSFTGCVIFGVGATASGNNQFVVGSGSDTVGVVNTETVTSTRTWSVYINGAAHKILLA